MDGIRIVVVEDDIDYRRILVQTLEAERFQVVAEAADGEVGVVKARELRPDLVVMDVRLPVRDGISATRAICQEPDPPKIVILTLFGQKAALLEALKAGATGFLLKSATPSEMACALRAALKGYRPIDPPMTGHLIVEALDAAEAPAGNVDLDSLGTREKEVLALVGEGLPDAHIARELGCSVPTVRTHLARARQKLGAGSRIQAGLMARHAGLPAPSQSHPNRKTQNR